MNNVTGLPPSTNYTPEQALHSALGMEMTEVLIIGYDKDGDFVVRSSRMSNRDALWLIERSKKYAIGDAR